MKFLSPNITFIIITETNRYTRDAFQKWNLKNSDKEQRVWREITSIELDVFIGVLLAFGVSHNNMQKISSTLAYRQFTHISISYVS